MTADTVASGRWVADALPFEVTAPAAAAPAAPVLSAAALAGRLGERVPTDEQARAIEAGLRPLAVVAGAGSGKTQTMALRVVWLVANGLVEPHRVLGLTFTRKAAAELGVRVRRMLRGLLLADERDRFLSPAVAAGLRAGEPNVSTYHAYAAALLGEHALRIGVEPSSRLVGEAVSWQHAMEVVEHYDGPMDAVENRPAAVVDSLLALAGDLAEHLRTPDELRGSLAEVCARVDRLPPGPGRGGGVPVRQFLARQRARAQLVPLVERYLEIKRERGVLDYGDQVAFAARLARDCDEVAELERARWGAVLLDEYQDTGEAQRVLLTGLFSGGRCVTAVGDPRQSIYGWRGASAGNLERFLDDFDGDPCAAVGLTRSFRNGERILEVANAVAAGIPLHGLDGRPLRPGVGREASGRVACALLETVDAEAQFIADKVAALGGRVAWGEIAVLARKRSHFPRIESALRARGVPCEIVGLGGLLLQPEVADVVATLQVLVDPSAGAAALRLLAGPRWRLGPRDLVRLGERASALARRRDARLPEGREIADERSIIDAIDDLGPPGSYSAAGYGRLVAFRDELRELRRWTGQPLPDLVTTVIRTIGVDIEVAARPHTSYADALAHLDRLVEEAEDFAATADERGLPAFLAYLQAAQEREDGLAVDQADVGGDRVQLLTVHAAKGLEWDVVVVAGLVDKVFPVEGRPVADWSKQLATLPFELRGDRSELPELAWRGARDLGELKAELDRFSAACKDRGRIEERRLAYVAMTRPREMLLCTGYWWDHTQKPRGPSELLDLVHDVGLRAGADPLHWAERPPEGAPNPVTATAETQPWPLDPLGGSREWIERAAADVQGAPRRAAAGAVRGDSADTDSAGPEVARWATEIELLLAEHERERRRLADGVDDVELPARLSVSDLVQLRRDPAQLARRLRRPVPQEPRPLARRGTRFHLWLEQRWGQQRLLDIDELPGSADDGAPGDVDLLDLQQAFRRSVWWSRTPTELEVPFELRLGPVVLRGRIDAVFTDAPDGLVDVIDWKTGSPPPAGDRDEAAARAVQLAAYRLAWHRLSGAPLARIRAAFHYVATGDTVSPVDLADERELIALVTASAVDDAPPA